jgi:hypothetical protein
MEILEVLKSALVQADNARARSGQVEIGASSIGGCRAQAWHIINQTPKTNERTEALAAILGTAIHSAIQEALLSYDVFGDDFLLEGEFQTPELKGHCDFYSREHKLVADWKTTSLKGLQKFPTRQQKIQVNLYGYLLRSNGYDVERVALVAIPRDGKMSDIVKWESNYDQSLVDEGLAWLAEVKAMPSPPPPERPAQIFCVNYCSFYDPTGEKGCVGK